MIKNGSLNQDEELEPEVKEAACAGEAARETVPTTPADKVTSK